jgi:purine-binding chemotaxis protein CheW
MSPRHGDSYLVFRAGGERLGLPIDRVQGAARARQIVPLPGAPPEYVGVTFVRGEPIGVLDAARALGCRTQRSKIEPGGVLVILEGERHALLVDSIDSVEELVDGGAGGEVAAPGESRVRVVSVDEAIGGGSR